MIQFKCMYCGEPMEAPLSLAGETMQCPQCDHNVIVKKPKDATVSPEDSNLQDHDIVTDDDVMLQGPPVTIQANDSSHSTPLPPGPSELPPPTPEQLPKIHFKCSCGQALKASIEHAGKRIHCPRCSQKRIIPDKSEY